MALRDRVVGPDGTEFEVVWNGTQPLLPEYASISPTAWNIAERKVRRRPQKERWRQRQSRRSSDSGVWEG